MKKLLKVSSAALVLGLLAAAQVHAQDADMFAMASTVDGNGGQVPLPTDLMDEDMRLDRTLADLLAYVDEYGVDEPGQRLAYTVDGPDGEIRLAQANAVEYLLRGQYEDFDDDDVRDILIIWIQRPAAVAQEVIRSDSRSREEGVGVRSDRLLEIGDRIGNRCGLGRVGLRLLGLSAPGQRHNGGNSPRDD